MIEPAACVTTCGHYKWSSELSIFLKMRKILLTKHDQKNVMKIYMLSNQLHNLCDLF